MIKKRRICRFCEEGIKHVDYKNDKFLNRFLTEQGKIIPRRTSGNCANHQRMLAMAVKRARHMAIIPFIREISR
ncbi:MAG: 30S ribosomal protein S18 [Deferribacteres bacterium]|nr:30S ribosomal protein S18 [candidate division KSB1 bacterium]MCB9502508.1 30S ribosomal protein S18 [Deferribacteres bacterium]